MSRKERRRQQRAAQQARQNQQRGKHEQRLQETLAVTTYVESEEPNDGFPYDPLSGEKQLYIETPVVIERHISVKRIPV